MTSLKILIAPNSFKGSLSSPRAAAAIGRGLKSCGLECDLDLMPIADGGDDTMAVLIGREGSVRRFAVQDPLNRPVEAELGLLADNDTAVVEMARASGLKLLKPEERDPLKTSTYGTGQLIARAVGAGCSRVIVGVGGSATVDGGAGCLEALGASFVDESGQKIPPGGGGLHRVRRLDLSGLDPRLKEIQIDVACDVENPTLGPRGAAAVFGPQKGATPEQVRILEENLNRFFTLAAETLGKDVRRTPRGGAAGALAAGLKAFLGAELRSGVELVLESLGAPRRLARADLVITGEGRLDSQTLSGKGPLGLARAAKEHGVPVVALAGAIGEGEAELAAAGLEAIMSICPGPLSLEEAMGETDRLLEEAAARLGRWLALGRGLN